MRRDSLFRRSLLAADVFAIVVALGLTVGLSHRSLGLTWASIACVPVLLFWAKLNGLYDRDEMLLRKTTLDEAPKLFQLATLFALVVWLADGVFVSGSSLDRRQALFLWIALTALLMLGRACARTVALRGSPVKLLRAFAGGCDAGIDHTAGRSPVTGHRSPPEACPAMPEVQPVL